MEKEIKISQKHGLNPSIPVCMFCGQQKNEIVLFGKIGGKNEDVEAPKNAIIDYEPCDKCKELIGDNILVVGVEDRGARNIMPIQGNLVPTGTWCVMPEESAVRIFQLEGEMKDNVLREKRLLVDNVILEGLLKQHEKAVAEAGDENGKE